MLGDGYTMAQTVDYLAAGSPAPVATAMTAVPSWRIAPGSTPVDSRAVQCPQVVTPAVTPLALSCASSPPMLASLRVCRSSTSERASRMSNVNWSKRIEQSQR
jgi:hypothetical protein